MSRIYSTVLALGLAGASVARAQLAITEVSSSAATNLGPAVVVQNSDFWELTNFGANNVDLTGYKWNDNAGGLTGADLTPFNGLMIGPGESILFFESNVLASASATQFRAWWGLPATVQAVPYIGNGLGSGGDGVRLWGPSAVNDANFMDSLDFGAATRGQSFVYNPATGAFGGFITNGVNGAFKAVTSDDVGSPGTTTGPVPMAVVTQPVNSLVNPGDTATFTVGWRGLPRPRFQWQFEGADIPDGRFATLSVSNVQQYSLGQYRVILDNGVESMTSSIATLALNPQPTPPQFILSPQNKSAFLGQSVTFTAQASGVPQPAYQWRHNDQDIPGANAAAHAIPSAGFGDAGFYAVVASNPSGAATNSATLLITRRPRLVITEICAAQSTNGASGGHSDWWELTNLDDFTVDLRGYRFDDNSVALGFSTVLSNATSIAAGESVIFVESMTPEAFRKWWGAENLPTNLQIIPYTGAGLSLSSLGDALNLWNSAALDDFDTVASEVFSTAAVGVPFGWNPEAGYFGDLSTNGLYGAFRAVESGDIGSPGYIRAPLRPRLLDITREPDGCRLRWTSVAGRNYTVQYKLNLTDPDWAQVRDVNNYDVWYNSVPPVMSQPRAADYFTRRPDFYERNSFFHCPGAKFPSGYATGNNPLFSVSMNSKLIEAPATNVQASAIAQPASTVVFLENLLVGEKPVDPAQPTTDLGQPSSYASRFVARHDGRGTMVFADGHAETFRGNQVVETTSGPYRGKAILPQDKIIWTPNPEDNPN